MIFRQLFDRSSCTYTYLLACERTRAAMLIDPVLECVERDHTLLAELGLTLAATVDTHVHADHITAASALKDRTGCQIVYPGTGQAEGPDRALADGERFAVGDVGITCRFTPGHTVGSACYVLDDESAVFTGDTLMIRGCGRTDFQGGSSEALYRSVHERLFRLPDACRVYPGHDYQGRTMSTIGEEKAHNPRLGGGNDLATFVRIMTDLKLAYPAKMDEAVPANRVLGRT